MKQPRVPEDELTRAYRRKMAELHPGWYTPTPDLKWLDLHLQQERARRGRDK